MDVMGYSILACKNALVLLLLTITGHVFTKTYKCVNFPYSKLVIEVPRINLQPQIRYNLMNYELLFLCVLVTLICTISLTVGWKKCRLPLNLAMTGVFWLSEVGRDYSLVLCYLL